MDQNLNRLRDEIARVFKFQFSADFSLVVENGSEEDARENDVVLDKMRNVIELSESYAFPNTKTWSDLTKIIEQSQQSTSDQTLLNAQIKSDLKDKVEKIGSNIHYMESQIDWINRGQWVVAGGEALISFTKFKLLTPLITTGKIKLEAYKETKINQVTRLKEEKANEETRLVDIEMSNAWLNEEKEKFKREIHRLQTLLREI